MRGGALFLGLLIHLQYIMITFYSAVSRSTSRVIHTIAKIADPKLAELH